MSNCTPIPMKKAVVIKAYLFTFVVLLLLLISVAACSSSDKITVVNNTSYTFCKVERTPNLSVYFPLQKRAHRIRLHPGETTSLSGGDKKHILHLSTCDGRYVAGNWPEYDDPWILTDDMLADMEAEYIPTPLPTRVPAVVTIVNHTGKAICSTQFSLRLKNKFGDNILARAWSPGEQIVLAEPRDIHWGTYVIKVHYCNGDEYITEAVTFEEIMTIILRGEESDAHNLLIEKSEEGQ